MGEGARQTATIEIDAAALLDLVGALVIAAADGTILDVNEDAAALLGVEGRALAGTSVQTLFHPADRRVVRRRADPGDGRPAGVPRPARTSGGNALEAEVRVSAAEPHGPGGAGLYIALEDVTETARTEQHLRELRLELERRLGERLAELETLSDELERRWVYLQTIVQHMPAGLVIADPESGAVTIANEQARAIVGLEVGFRLGTPPDWEDAGGFDVVTGPGGLLSSALSGEIVSAERVMLTRPTGEEAIVEISAAPIHGADGSIVAAVGVFQDVTEAEVRRRAAADFITNAAHELRTPLAAIGSAVEVLQAGAKLRPAERDRFLAHIGRETDRLVRTTRALLVLARAQSGVEAPRLEIVEVEPLLREVASGLRPARGVRVLVRARPEAGVVANRGLLEQAVSALASNAARYTAAGRISLSASQGRNGDVLLRVRDTGRGMTPEQLAAAGDRFAPVVSPDGGFGLGLAIAREAVKALGATLRLEAAPGGGTIAMIALPGARLVTAP